MANTDEIQEKMGLLSQLIELAKSDHHLSDKEKDFIHTLGKRMGLLENQIIELFQNPAPYSPVENEFDRILQFHRLVLLMNVDEHVSHQEMQETRIMGMKLGLHPEAIEEVLNRMFDYENNVIPPDDLMAIFLRHHN